MIGTLQKPALLTLFLLAPVMSSCAVVKATVSPPVFEVQNMRLTRYSIPNLLNPFDGQATFLMDVKVTNPNSFNLNIRRIRGDLTIDGQAFGEATIQDFQLAAKSSTLMTTEFTVPVGLNLASKIADIASGRRVNYDIKALVQVDAGLLGTATFSNIVVAQGTFGR